MYPPSLDSNRNRIDYRTRGNAVNREYYDLHFFLFFLNEPPKDPPTYLNPSTYQPLTINHQFHSQKAPKARQGMNKYDGKIRLCPALPCPALPLLLLLFLHYTTLPYLARCKLALFLGTSTLPYLTLPQALSLSLPLPWYTQLNWPQPGCVIIPSPTTFAPILLSWVRPSSSKGPHVDVHIQAHGNTQPRGIYMYKHKHKHTRTRTHTHTHKTHNP